MIIESTEVNCETCYITLKIRTSVSVGRVSEILRQHGWEANRHEEDGPYFCSVCKKESGKLPL